MIYLVCLRWFLLLFLSLSWLSLPLFRGSSVTSIFVVVLSSYLSVSSFILGLPLRSLFLLLFLLLFFVVVPSPPPCFLRGGALFLFIFLCGGRTSKPPERRKERAATSQSENRQRSTKQKHPPLFFLFDVVPHLSLSLLMWWFLLSLFRFRGGPSVHIKHEHFTQKSTRRTRFHSSLQHFSCEQV